MNIFIKNKYDHLFMKEDQLFCLFVCFVPQVQISQTTMLLLVLLVLLESP